MDEPIKVKQTRGESVLGDNLPGVSKKVLAEFNPVTGRVFARLEFTGGNCVLNPIEVTGIVLGSFFSDPLSFGGTTAEQLEIERAAGEPKNAETETSSVLKNSPTQKNPFIYGAVQNLNYLKYQRQRNSKRVANPRHYTVVS
ncbi:MAG TPA: hypothetical protein VNV37_02620 [Solirubrobacteraceae bacterium]|nr:hypothetical protein [Solirubrobacteraceae bacterium]